MNGFGHGRWLWLVLAALLSGCRVKSAMHELDPDLNRMLKVPRYDIYEEGRFFADHMTMRRPPDGTVPFDAETGNRAYLRGIHDGRFVPTFPLELSRELIERGRGRFERTCAACHATDGEGNDPVIRHMRRKPPSLHSPRVRALPPGKVFSIISNGYGFMPSYAAKLSIRDRWAVVAYLQVLQRSQYAPLAELPEAIRQRARRKLP